MAATEIQRRRTRRQEHPLRTAQHRYALHAHFTERRGDERNDSLAGSIESARIFFPRNTASRLVVWGQFAGRSSELGVLPHLLRTVLNCAFQGCTPSSHFCRTNLNSQIHRMWKKESSFGAKFKYPGRSVSRSSHGDSV